MDVNTWKINDFMDIRECINLLKYIQKCAKDEEKIDILWIALQLCKVFMLEVKLDDLTEKIQNKINEVVEDKPEVDFVFHDAGNIFAEMTKKIQDALQKYYDGEIDKKALIELIMVNGIGDVKIDLENNVKDHIGKIGIKAQSKLMLSWSVVSIALLAGAYLILKKSMKEYYLAKEERIRVEKECEEAIVQIIEYRHDLALYCEKYFKEHYIIIESSLSEMDHALLENDVDGFIAGNTAIQKLLKYDTQFNTQAEFDHLMDIEDSFKL